MMKVRIFVIMLSGLHKVGKNKTVGRDVYRNKPVSIIQMNCIVKAVTDKKINKMMKWTAEVVVAVTAAVWKVRRQNQQCSSYCKGSGCVPADFQAKKSHIVILGLVFVEERRPRLRPVPHSRTFNGSKGVKTIHQPSYLPNTASADYYLLQRGEIGASTLIAVPGRPHDELRGCCSIQKQKRDCRHLFAVDR
jgi:hypothetical protein